MKTIALIVVACVLCACGGGQDHDLDQRKETPLPHCDKVDCK